jgi:hypothetical protein
MGTISADEALRRVLLWQQTVLRDPDRVMKGLDDPMSAAVGLFMGPIWEDAINALSPASRETLTTAFLAKANTT